MRKVTDTENGGLDATKDHRLLDRDFENAVSEVEDAISNLDVI